MTTTTARASVLPDDAAFTALAERLRGNLVRPGTRDYAEATDVFNAAVDHRPAHVVRAADTADVVQVVRFAREQGLDLSVRGGGHGVAGHAIAGELVLDLSLMRDVDVHLDERLARAQGGCLLRDLDVATQRHGLATPAGRVTHTGIAGLTLGGGQGWLSPRHGLSCDNLVSAEVVTADGRVVVAGRGGDEELLWALRGGGGNFGVVTRFDYRLHPLDGVVLAGIVVHPAARAHEVVERYVELASTAGPDLGGAIVFATAPPVPFLPPEAVGQPVLVTTLAWFGDPAEGERRMRPFRTGAGPVADLVGPMPYLALQALTDDPNPRGMRQYWHGGYVQELPSPLVDVMVDALETKHSPLSAIVVAQMGEGTLRVPEESAAYPHRDAQWLVHPVAMWPDAASDDRERAWVDALVRSLRPYERGGYLNTDSAQDQQGRVRAVFGDERYARLAAVKQLWDPDNVFHHNANVVPAGRHATATDR